MEFLQNNIWMVLVAISSATMLLWSLFGNRLRGVQEVNSVALVLDVREEKEFNAGHILNAKLVPLGKIADHMAELERYRERPIVVVCRSGQRSASACLLLSKQGFGQAYNLEGGVLAWQKASLPLEK